MYKQFNWVTLEGEQQKLQQSSCTTDPCHEATKRKTMLMHEEFLAENMSFSFPLEEELFTCKTDYQNLRIVKTPHFGKLFLIDNVVQSAESDESVYHESLVHPALLSHKRPKRVFIGGGGEGGTLREVLRHKDVEEVVMCDIDGVAVEACKKHLPEWGRGAFEDPRSTVVYGDANDYLLKNTDMKFDVVIMDICDPIEDGPGWQLYTKEFYERVCRDNMRDDTSIFCTQSTAVNLNLISECFTVIHRTLKQAFKHVHPYRCSIPSFGTDWGFNVCSNSDVHLLSGDTAKASIDDQLRQRLSTPPPPSLQTLQHYCGSCHAHMFNLTRYEIAALAGETRTLTLSTPIYMSHMSKANGATIPEATKT